MELGPIQHGSGRNTKADEAQVALLASIVDSSDDAIIAKTLDGVIRTWNRGAELIYGYRADEIVGKPIKVLSHPDRPDEMEAILKQIRRGQRIEHYETTRIRKDGKTIAVSLSVSPILDELGRVAGVASIARDITERKRADEQARATSHHAPDLSDYFTKSEQAREGYREAFSTGFHALFEAAAEGIVILELDGTILRVNRKAAELQGCPAENIVGRHFLEFVPEARREIEQVRFDEVVSGCTSRVDNVEVIAADGTERIVDLTNSVVDLGDKRVVFTIERDVTSERRATEQIRQLQRLESLGQLTGGVAHDFNNILAAVLANSEMLLDALDAHDPRREDVEEIKKAGLRGAAITSQLLAFSRRQRLDPKLVNLNDIVGDLQKMLRRLIGEDVALSFKASPDLGAVMADATQLQQVIMNLAINARDAMPRGGELLVETSNVDLDDQFAAEHIPLSPGPHVVLSITDTGTGMDENTKQHLFEPFFTTKPVGKGTGLGLATCYGIVKQSGGHIWVYSELGKGTVFNVYLPRVAGGPEQSRPSDASIEQHGKELVLVIEDDELLRTVLQRALEARGYRVLVAANGNEAVEIAQAHGAAIEIFLCDAIIPGPSGLELLHELGTFAPAARVLFMSGYADHAVLRDDVLKSRMQFLQKPFTMSALASALRRLVEHSQEGSCVS